MGNTYEISTELINLSIEALTCRTHEIFKSKTSEEASLSKEQMITYNLTEENVWRREEVLFGLEFDKDILDLKMEYLSDG